jgi:hypothetical protein
MLQIYEVGDLNDLLDKIKKGETFYKQALDEIAGAKKMEFTKQSAYFAIYGYKAGSIFKIGD